MPTLTEEQEQKIAQKRRLNKPTYYDSALRIRQQINEDTEAAIILLGTSTKDNITRYLKAFLDRESRSSNYSDLLDEFVTQQETNLDAAVTEMDTIFSGYTAIKKELMGDGNEVFLIGMQPLLKSFALALGRLKRQHDSLVYAKVHQQSSKTIASVKLTAEQRREINSWIPVLASYP